MGDYKKNVWRDSKGRDVLIHTMSDKWLKNIMKSVSKNNTDRNMIAEEIKRRKLKNKNPLGGGER